MRVDEVRVRGAVFERLEAVAHAARHVDRLGRVEAGGVHLAEALARAQVDPRAEHRAGRDADVLVPRLGVDTAGHALLRVERDVVLHRPEIGQAQRGHLRALPVLLEPAAVVAVHRQVEHDQAGDVRPLDLQFLLKIHESHSLMLLFCSNSSQQNRKRLFPNSLILQKSISYSEISYSAEKPCFSSHSGYLRDPALKIRPSLSSKKSEDSRLFCFFRHL